MAWLTRKPLVALLDFDGEVTVRLVHRGYFNDPLVRRFPFGIKTVRLNPDGTISPRCYVKRWRALMGNPFPQGANQ